MDATALLKPDGAHARTAPGTAADARPRQLSASERLADLIRPLLAWRQTPEGTAPPPKGSTGDGGFIVTPEMMSILGDAIKRVA